MVRSTCLVLAAALLAGPAAPGAHAQPAPPAPPSVLAAPPEPEFLQTFPRPPDAPGSLLAPPLPPGPPAPDLERPYFQVDPLLDPPPLGLPGWFFDVDVGILKPHLTNEQALPVTFANGATTSVGVDPPRLNWAASPTIELGYRLPSGFGGIAVSWRGLATQGAQNVFGADGPATLSSRLDYNIANLDWVSQEYTPWHVCDMWVRFGLRYFNDYYDSQATEPFAEAALGSTLFNQRTTNSSWTIGPHAGVALRKRLNFYGLGIMTMLDLSEGWGRVRQNYFASSTAPSSLLGAPAPALMVAKDPPGSATASISTSDAIPLLFTNLGLSWQPPTMPNSFLFLGVQLDYFWNTGRTGNFSTYSYFFDSGIILRAAFNY